MPDGIFSTNTGSFQYIEITASLVASQSAVINFASASLVTGSFSGRITTSSYAISASSLTQEYSARVYSTTTQSINDSTDTTLNFNTKKYDFGGFYNAATSSRLTAPVTGRYDFFASAVFTSNSTGYRLIYFRINGATLMHVDARPAPNGVAGYMSIAGSCELTASDYVEVRVKQNSGGALSISTSDTDGAGFAIHKVN